MHNTQKNDLECESFQVFRGRANPNLFFGLFDIHITFEMLDTHASPQQNIIHPFVFVVDLR